LTDAQPTTIAILAAVLDELTPVAQRLGLAPAGRPGHAFVGRVGSADIVAMVTGIGPARAVAALDHIQLSHAPALLISAGFAGGLDPDLKAGDSPQFLWVIDDAGHAIKLTDGVPRPSDAAMKDAPLPGGADGPRLLTLDRIADTVAAKRELFARHRAAAVDMETYPLARRAAELNLPLRVVRAISDPADFALPAEVLQWVKPDGSTDTAAATRYALSHPLKVPMLMQLQKYVKLAGERLADRVAELLRTH
jgi:adenosylhomocysteine nucleosidase